MIDAVLAPALALLCSINSPDAAQLCTKADSVKIEAVSQQLNGYSFARATFDPSTRTIRMIPYPVNAVMAGFIAHELTHVEQIDAGRAYNNQTCLNFEQEAYTNQAQIYNDLVNPGQEIDENWVQHMANADCRHSAI